MFELIFFILVFAATFISDRHYNDDCLCHYRDSTGGDTFGHARICLETITLVDCDSSGYLVFKHVVASPKCKSWVR